jgi:hypothetical protein
VAVQPDYGSVSPHIVRQFGDQVPPLVRDLCEGRMPAGRWNDVAALLDQLASALASGDAEAADKAVSRLEVEVSGHRTGGVGEVPPDDVPPPPQVRELAVHLLHVLNAPPLAEPADGDRPADPDPAATA